MEWFRILLLVWIGLGIIEFIAKSGGWRPKVVSWGYAFDAVITTLFFVGIWLWL